MGVHAEHGGKGGGKCRIPATRVGVSFFHFLATGQASPLPLHHPPSPVCESPLLVLGDTMCIYERGFTWTRVGFGAPGSVRSGGAGCGGGISFSLVMSHVGRRTLLTP